MSWGAEPSLDRVCSCQSVEKGHNGRTLCVTHLHGGDIDLAGQTRAF